MKNSVKIGTARMLKILVLCEDVYEGQTWIEQLSHVDIVFEVKFVQKRIEYVESLFTFQPNCIIAENSSKTFGGYEALYMLKETYLDIPFLAIIDAPCQNEEREWNGMKASAIICKTEIDQLGEVLMQVWNTYQESLNNDPNQSVLYQIRENINGLDEIRSFLMAGRAYPDELSQGVQLQINDSIHYLQKLHTNLKNSLLQS